MRNGRGVVENIAAPVDINETRRAVIDTRTEQEEGKDEIDKWFVATSRGRWRSHKSYENATLPCERSRNPLSPGKSGVGTHSKQEDASSV